MIHVCSLARLHATVEDTGARHVVSLLGDEAPIDRPTAIVEANHLWLRLHDISAPLDGYILPGRGPCGGSVKFRAPLGSPHAAGRALLCGHQPLDRERLHHRLCAQSPARRDQHRASLRRASPTATPNIRIVSLADRLLGRDGRMVSAIETIGRGEIAVEGNPFRLELE